MPVACQVPTGNIGSDPDPSPGGFCSAFAGLDPQTRFNVQQALMRSDSRLGSGGAHGPGPLAFR
jgi:hypothetical protein